MGFYGDNSSRLHAQPPYRCEKPRKQDNMIGMVREIERRLAKYDEIGEFDQKI